MLGQKQKGSSASGLTLPSGDECHSFPGTNDANNIEVTLAGSTSPFSSLNFDALTWESSFCEEGTPESTSASQNGSWGPQTNSLDDSFEGSQETLSSRIRNSLENLDTAWKHRRHKLASAPKIIASSNTEQYNDIERCQNSDQTAGTLFTQNLPHATKGSYLIRNIRNLSAECDVEVENEENEENMKESDHAPNYPGLIESEDSWNKINCSVIPVFSKGYHNKNVLILDKGYGEDTFLPGPGIESLRKLDVDVYEDKKCNLESSAFPEVEPPTSGLLILTLDNSRAASLSRACKFGGHFRKVPSGGEVTVGELREMATRQQRQIESQQQLLVAKEQRLKYLKQQEGRAPQVTLEAERLRRLRERVEAQEAKLKRLRALRGQVDTSRLNAASLSSDLDAMRHLFSEKEKELVDAAAKVEELTQQLEEVRSGRTLGGGGGAPPNPLHIHQQELEKLRRELLYRNSVNREAVARVASQRDALTSRKDEIARIDKRIAELQQRLHRKRVLNQQLASQISAATQAKQAQLKAVQQKAFREGNKDNSADDVTCEKIRTMEDLAQFERGKHDPKYQTLPYNTKFSSAVKGRNGSGCYDPDLHQAPSHLPPAPNEHPANASLHGINSNSGTSHNGTMSAANNNVGVVTRTVHSIPTHLPSRGHASAPGVTSSSNSLGSTSASTTSYNSSSTSSSNTMTRNQLNNQTNNHSANKPNSSTQNYSPKNLTEEPTKPILPNANNNNNNNNNQNSSSNQDLRANLPPTSLSVSFAQKLSPGVGAHASTRSAVQPVNKDVENVRALGYPSGSASFTNSTKTMNANGTPSSSSTEEDIADTPNDRKMKPILPPKPAVPSKPTPPPRQKGDPMAGSTESLNFSGVSHRSNGQTRPQVFRYASQNVIMSTYTQHQQQQQHQLQQPSVSDIQSQLSSRESPPKSTNSMAPSSQPESSISNTESEAKEAISIAPSAIAKENTNKDIASVDRSPEKVHISINRRIEMPPDFLFPEGATPPSDLLGRQLEEMVKVVSKNDTASKSSNETTDKININSSVTNNNNNNNTNNNTTNNNNHMPNINTGSINLNTIHASVNATLNEIERLRIGSTDKEDRFNHELQGLNNVTSCSNITIEDLADKDSSEDINDKDNDTTDDIHHLAPPSNNSIVVRRLKKGNLKTTNSSRAPRRVSFDPLALLLDASLEGELELVKRTATEVPNPSAANDEGITALHNAICAGHLDIVTFLVTFGCDVNAQDSDGWTPLHCAASCNNVAMVRFLVEHGACVLATTLSDHETAAEKCEQDEEGYDGCSQYLYSIQEKLGIMNGGSVYGVFDYDANNEDELCFKCGDAITIIRRGDEYEREWWWARLSEKCGYIPRNLLGLYPRVKNPFKNS